VPALLVLWYPGEQGGTALAEILFGEVNPSGRLPITVEKRQEDNPTFANYYPEAGTNRVVYKEGIFVGYRGYEHNDIKPLFPFGFGLSYTTFNFGSVAVKNDANQTTALKYLVSFDITNTGSRAGAEVAEVYIAEANSPVSRPPKELKGFVKVDLQPGETRRVTVPLDTRSFAYYDVNGAKWRVPSGTYQVLIGKSSEEIDLTAEITVATVVTEKP